MYVGNKQPLYPRLYVVLRLVYLVKRAFSHLRFMDFTLTPVQLDACGLRLESSRSSRWWRC